jgi:hypothetical protein
MEDSMSGSTAGTRWPSGPKRRERHHNYDESVDEPASLLEDEAVEVEEALPAEENDPVEAIEGAEECIPPAFDEGAPSRDEPHE